MVIETAKRKGSECQPGDFIYEENDGAPLSPSKLTKEELGQADLYSKFKFLLRKSQECQVTFEWVDTQINEMIEKVKKSEKKNTPSGFKPAALKGRGKGTKNSIFFFISFINNLVHLFIYLLISYFFKKKKKKKKKKKTKKKRKRKRKS